MTPLPLGERLGEGRNEERTAMAHHTVIGTPGPSPPPSPLRGEGVMLLRAVFQQHVDRSGAAVAALGRTEGEHFVAASQPAVQMGFEHRPAPG